MPNPLDPLPPDYVLPNWTADNFCHIPATVDRMLGVASDGPMIGEPPPEPAAAVVSLFVDALGWAFVEPRLDHPVLRRFHLRTLTTQFPSSTGGCVPTHKTGLPSPVHGVPSMRYFEPRVADLCDPLKFARRGAAADLRATDGVSVADVFPFETRTARLARHGVGTVTVTPRRFSDSAFNLWAADGGTIRRFDHFAELPSVIDAALAARTGPLFVDAYMDDLDKLGHEAGPDAPAFGELVGRILTLLGEAADVCAARGARLVFFADHGQVSTAAADYVRIDERCPGIVAELRRNGVGEPLMAGGGTRMAFLYVRDAEAAAALLRPVLSDCAVVATTDELIVAGLFGDRIHPEFRARIGDVAILPLAKYHLWLSFNRKELHKGAHGGLHRDEMLIPFGVL